MKNIYYFDRHPESDLPARCFEHNGRTYEIAWVDRRHDDMKRVEWWYGFREVGTTKVYEMQEEKLIKKLTRQ